MNIGQALHTIMNANEEDLIFEKTIQEGKVRSAEAELKNGAGPLSKVKKSFGHAGVSIIELILALKNGTKCEK